MQTLQSRLNPPCARSNKLNRPAYLCSLLSVCQSFPSVCSPIRCCSWCWHSWQPCGECTVGWWLGHCYSSPLHWRQRRWWGTLGQNIPGGWEGKGLFRLLRESDNSIGALPHHTGTFWGCDLSQWGLAWWTSVKLALSSHRLFSEDILQLSPKQ